MSNEKRDLLTRVKEKFQKHKVLTLIVGGILLFFIFNNLPRSVQRDMDDMFYDSGLGFGAEMMNQALPSAPSMARSNSRSYNESAEISMQSVGSAGGGYDAMSIPEPSPYVANLEKYETTDYNARAHTKDFDEACTLLYDMKADQEIDFRSISTSLNSCSATFYTTDELVPFVLASLEEIDGVEISSNTQSVTRKRQNLQTEAGVLLEQLESVEKTLAMAELQYEDLTMIARQAGDASSLTEAIRDKINTVESLSQKRISLLNRIRRIDQQSADLEERLGVVAFNVSFSRSNPINLNEHSREWVYAWEAFKDQTTAFLIGLTINLGIFMLKVMQFAVYALLLLLIVRFGWKGARRLWQL